MKKIYFLIPLIILLIAGLWFFVLKKPQTNEEKRVSPAGIEEVNVLPIEERPYMTLTPTADGHFLDLVIVDPRGYKSVDYEFEYQAGTSIKGGIGSFDFTKEPPFEKRNLLGTQSKNDYYFDENVSGGSFTFRFLNGKKETLKTDFTLQEAKAQAGRFTSRDLKVILDVGEKGLPDNTFVVITQTLGMPEKATGEILAGPYGFFTAEKKEVSSASLTFQSKKDLTGAKILAWNGNKWEEITQGLKVEEGKITAQVSQLTTYVVVR